MTKGQQVQAERFSWVQSMVDLPMTVQDPQMVCPFLRRLCLCLFPSPCPFAGKLMCPCHVLRGNVEVAAIALAREKQPVAVLSVAKFRSIDPNPFHLDPMSPIGSSGDGAHRTCPCTLSRHCRRLRNTPPWLSAEACRTCTSRVAWWPAWCRRWSGDTMDLSNDASEGTA